MKTISVVTVFFIISITSFSYCQTVTLGNIEISIGDSLSQIQSKIDTVIYHLYLSNTVKMKLTGYLIAKNHPETDIAYISFEDIREYEPQCQPKVTSIEKIWANDFWENNKLKLLDVMQKFYGLLEVFGIDKYDKNISFEKKVEPEGTSSSISISTSSWHSIEFYFDKDMFKLSEYFCEDAHHFDDKIYYLIFDDYNHYTNKKSNLIIEKFQKEDDAEMRYRELTMNYAALGIYIPKCEILRVWRNGFDTK